ncbi:erythrocyte membrane protein 1, PfEMP1, putative [Plasmodium gaboni]|uniref:Erythrocyte membrane protein 1, PfEMP1, putative n=1 Tax=Plasmodium gaboni TaxID=647221 RepID=A0ABY1UI61_9APIC|nr:erythrocyte membrane protein 1, PfEMP1, putative [Plasmodium gaboni]
MGSRGSKFRDETLQKYKDIIGDKATSWGYGEYIHFLMNEIKNKSWDNLKYDTFLKEKGWDDNTLEVTVDKICAWEKVQQDIFRAVMDDYSTTAFTWEEKAKDLLIQARKEHFSGQTCDIFNENLYDESDKRIIKPKTVCDSHIIKGLCIPQRRKNFDLKNLNDTLYDILSSKDEQYYQINAKSALPVAIGGLANQVKNGIVDLKTKHFKTNEEICTLMRRIYADAKDLFNTKDIYDNKLSINVQCMLKNISKYLKDDNSIDTLMKKYFKDEVEKKLNEEHVYEDDNKKSPCNLDHSYYIQTPQCLRFLEEWIDDFIKEKERFETNIKEICLEGKSKVSTLIDGKQLKIPCEKYCYEYNRLLNQGKTCYNSYLTECKKNLMEHHVNYNNEETAIAEISTLKKKIIKNYNCVKDCGKYGSEKLDPFFDPNILSQHETFCCGCINNPSDIKKVFGKKDKESSYIDAVLNKLKMCASKDEKLDGAKYGKIKTDSGKVTDICMIHYTDSFLRGRNTCSGLPCVNNIKKGKSWICDSKFGNFGEHLKNGWTDGTISACLPPRTQQLCLGRIYSNSCTRSGIDKINTNEQLLNELIIAARFESAQLYNTYIIHDKTKNRSYEEKMKRLCNAAKYSFADLGDIVKGTSIWESNDAIAMETNLRTIFAKIHKTFYYQNQQKYEDKDNDGTYKKLREVWWNTNRQHIWKALVCGIKNVSGRSPITCIKEGEPPNIDYMPQFLRFLEEWSQYLCEEQKEKLNDVQSSCNICKGNANKCSSKNGNECKKCDNACTKYRTFMFNSEEEYKKQKNKYTSEIDKYLKNINKNSNNPKYINDKFYNLIKRHYKNISYYLNERLNKDNNNCGFENNKHIDFNNENKSFKEIPEGYEKACNCKDPSRDTKSDKNVKVSLKANLEKSACMLDKKDNVYDKRGTVCNNSKSAGKDKNWQCNLSDTGFKLKNGWNKGNNDKGACLPPRTQEICLANLSKEDLKSKIHEKSNDGNVKNTKLLTEISLAAKHEGALLWEWYKNNPLLACMKLRNSYADYADLVKGTSIWENNNSKRAEDNIGNILKDIFNDKLASEYKGDINKLKEDWWEANKQDVWNAMTCGIPEYATFVIPNKPTNGGGIEYNVTGKCGYSHELPDDDEIPQFLRWFKEWSSDFCSEKNKYDINNAFVNTIEEDKNILSMCKGCSTSGTDCLSTYDKSNYRSSYVTCATCKKTCNEYTEWIKNQKLEFYKQKNKYDDLMSKAKDFIGNNHNSNVDVSLRKMYEYLKNPKDPNSKEPDQYLQSNVLETQCSKNVDVDFTKIDNTFNEKHKYCRTCDKQPHLKKIFPNLNFTEDGIDDNYPGHKATGKDVRPSIKPNTPVKPTESTTTQEKTDNINIDNSKGIICTGVKELSMVNDSEVDICMPYDYELDGSGLNKQNRKKYMISHIPTIECKNSVFHNNKKGGCGNGCPCKTEKPNNKKWKWTEAQHNSSKAGLKKDKNYANTIGVPPRTQVLCFGNIHAEGCENDVSKINDNYQLLTEWVIAAKIEGENLKKQHNGDSNKLKKALGYSYADIGDLIKGTSIWQNKWTQKLETNLNKWFKIIFKDHIQQKGQTTNSDKYPSDLTLLREVWWNTNKGYIWHSLVTGAKSSNSSNELLDNIEKENQITDYIPQFLRFAQEWVEHFCEKRKDFADNVVSKCNTCKAESDDYHSKNTIDSKKVKGRPDGGSNGQNIYKGEGGNCWMDKNPSGENSNECTSCKDMCDKYTKFVQGTADNDAEGKTWRERWQQMDKKYRELIEKYKNQNGTEVKSKCKTEDDCVQPTEAGIFKYLYDNGVSTLSSYMNFLLKDSNCGEDKPKWVPTIVASDTSGKSGSNIYPQPLDDKPSGYKYACECRIPSREELCDDNQLYRNRWECGTTTSGTSGSANTSGEQVQSRKKRSATTNRSYDSTIENGGEDIKKKKRTVRSIDEGKGNLQVSFGGNTSSAQKTGFSTDSAVVGATNSSQKYQLCHFKHGEINQNDSNKSKNLNPGGKKLSDDDIQFFNLFDAWYKGTQNQLYNNWNKINNDCNIEENMEKISTSNIVSMVPEKCVNCRDNCECYKLWVKYLEHQWKIQQNNYQKFEENKEDSNELPLSHYLFARCWEEYFGKNLSEKMNNVNHSTDDPLIDLSIERCGEKPDESKTKFEEKIQRAKKKTNECDARERKCKAEQKIDLNCHGINSSFINCPGKTYDDIDKKKKNNETVKKWLCEDNSAYLKPGACVPPRTQTLCVANMYDSLTKQVKLENSEGDLEKRLKAAMKKETENLYQYYKDQKAIISQYSGDQNSSGPPDVNGLPKNFCKAAERTYNDFKHMVIGDIPWKPPSFSQIHNKIEQILKRNKDSTSTTQSTTPEDWWNKNEYEFWDAIKCGIQTKHGNGATGNECGRHPPNDTDDPFVWWFKEWAQQFCIERQKKIDAINNTCDSSADKRCEKGNGGINKTLKDGCKEKCEDYKNFIEDKKDQWTQQKSKYERENPGKFAHELLGHDYPECVGANFENIFGDTTTISGASGKPSASGSTSGYGDAGDICSCTDQIYNCKGSDSSTCRDKSGHTVSWRTHLLKTGKHNKKLEGVYAPPRRQKLCLANLHPINFGKGQSTNIEKKKMTLLNSLQIVAEREAYFLWKYYHPNSSTSTTAGTADTNEDKRACCAIRSSFFDIGDIVKGTDLWDDASKKYIDKTLNDLFKQELEDKEKTKKKKDISKNKQMYSDPISYARKTWWEEKRNSVWDAMQCGVKNAITKLKGKSEQVGDNDLPQCMKDENGKRTFYLFATPQFVRWLKEWTQQFCEEYKTYFGDVVKKCGSSAGNNDCNDKSNNECKEACTKYNDWITSKKTEWNGMKNYYDTIIRTGKSSDQSPDGTDYHAINQRTVIDYLNQTCKTPIDGTKSCCFCENIGKENTSVSTSSKFPKSNNINDKPLEHIDSVMLKNDEKYNKYNSRCTGCYIQHIKDQIKAIEDMLKQKRKTEDEEAKDKYAFDCDNSDQTGKDDELCRKLTDGGNIEEAQKLKVPFNPDEKKRNQNKENDGMNCGGIPSDTNDIKWVGQKDHYKWLPNLDKNIYVSPRRQKLCYNGLDGSKTEHELRYKLLRGAANEGYNLGIKYNDYKNHYGVKPCKALEYSFRDYYNIIMGTDHLEDQGEGTDKSIKESLQNLKVSKGTSTKDHDKRKQFWEQNKDCLWKIMKCGYEKGKANASNNSNVPQLKSQEGGGINNECDMPDTNNNDQFLSWMQEWYDDYCNIRKMLKSEVENNCKGNGQYFNCEKCPTSCDKYKDYMNKKKQEWDAQKNYYSEKKNGTTRGYDKDDAKDYLKNHITFTCGDPSSGTNTVETNITALQQTPKYDVDSHCGCKKYIDESEYNRISGGTNCEGLKKAAESNKIKWDNSDGGLSYLKGTPFNKDLISPNVYLPPRKQKLCFQDLDNRKFTTTQDLRQQLMKVAAIEGYNLGEYYKAKNGSGGKDKDNYSYDVEPCNAMKYSFLDLRDIILGYDMVENDDTETGKKIKQIIHNAGTPGSDKRRTFWKDNKDCVWNAMKCGYQKSGATTLTNCDTIPSETEYPIGDTRDSGKNYQFLRWFAEWAEDFCIKQKKELEKLQKHCPFNKCEDASRVQKDQCLNACGNYRRFINNWKPQYKRQNIMYEGLPDTITLITNKEAPQFFTDNFKVECLYFNDKNRTTIDKVFPYHPKGYEEKCKCTNTPPNTHPSGHSSNNDTIQPSGGAQPQPPKQDEFKEFETCPIVKTNIDICNKYNRNRICGKKKNSILIEHWYGKDMLIPPRRRNLCLQNITRKHYYKSRDGKNKFKLDLISAAMSEASFLTKNYNDKNEALQAIKYTFADIGDIIKGTDMMEDFVFKDIKGKLEKVLDSSKNDPKKSEDWWEKNKKHIWHAMLCGYKNAGGTITYRDCMLPQEETEDQFLRWLKEWGTQACKEKKSKASDVLEKCNISDLKELKQINQIVFADCKYATDAYMQWIYNGRVSWKFLSNKYKNDKEKKKDTTYKSIPYKTAKDYMDIRCYDCDCNLDDFDEVYNEGKISQVDKMLKTIDKAKRDLPNGGWGIYWGEWKSPSWPEFELPQIALPKISWEWIHSFDSVFENVLDEIKKGAQSIDSVISSVKSAMEKNADDAKSILDKLFELGKLTIDTLENTKEKEHTPKEKIPKNPQSEPDSGTPFLPPQSDQPINTDILNTTLPVGISFALGSIALLYYLKKKPKLGPTKLFRVLDIPQNDYGIPDETSTNRYVPYGQYKGKTYIYVEHDDDSKDDKYMFTSDTTDVTSSESEYEEVDINDIYPYKSPKYKTLIEVVLKPSTNNNVQDNYTDDVKDNSDKPTDKFTDEEWNQLKQDFISQYLQNIGPDVQLNNELQSDNIPKHIQPDIIHNNMEEKPFITQIQDRKLYSDDNEIIYNIDWNVPKNISTNTTDDSKYVSNDQYTGIDLINDSLNSGNDIYDELLKRKENELYGTKHTKNTSTNRVAKQIVGDPISNQIDLFHKWLDRHRNMCKTWNNKEEMLSKLNEEWNKENKEHIFRIPLNDNDINKNNDETYNMINENTNELNAITSLEDFASTNIPYSDLITQNNDSQRQNLRTNISMDIHFDENNNITREDQLENMYNF